MNIIKLNAIDSTSSYLSEMARSNAIKDETVVVTDNQVKGRGQRDNVWQSQPKKSLTFSVFKRIDGLPVNHQFKIAMQVAIAVVTYLNKEVNIVFSIKWPNDIMAEGKKCGGILIENQLRGSAINATIVGLGLNLNEEMFENLPQATSLFLVTNKKFDLDVVLKGIVTEIVTALHLLSASSLSKIQEEYEHLLFKKGIRSKFCLPDGTPLIGVIKGVTTSGQLIMELADGKSLKFWNKEIVMVY